MDSTRSYRRLDFLEAEALKAFMAPHIVPQPDGFCSYEVGWSDTRIAEDFRATDPARFGHVKNSHVEALRRKVFGTVYRKVPQAPPPEADSPAALRAEFQKYRRSTDTAIFGLSQQVAELARQVAAVRMGAKP